jgi:hypothetical protein
MGGLTFKKHKMNKNYLKLFILTLLLMPVTTFMVVDTFDLGGGMKFIFSLICFGMICLTLAFSIDKTLATPDDAILPAFRSFRGWLIAIFILALIPIKQPKAMYNQSVVAYNAYTQKSQQRGVYFDKMAKGYYQKKEISFINFDQFKQITGIIMENKKDGAQLAWKWLSEQKVIPFEEFTSLWKDLSRYVETQREGYYQLEVECQQLANANNTLLGTFPNNVYNMFLGRPYIDYKYGFTSDKTVEVFQTRRENLPVSKYDTLK